MTRQRRLLLASMLAAWVGMVLACGGGGNQPANLQKKAEAEQTKAEAEVKNAEAELTKAEAEMKKAEAELTAKGLLPVPPLPNFHEPDKLVARFGTPDEDRTGAAEDTPTVTNRWIVYKREGVRALYARPEKNNPLGIWVLVDFTDVAMRGELKEDDVLKRLAGRDPENERTQQAKVVAMAAAEVAQAKAKVERAKAEMERVKAEAAGMAEEERQQMAKAKAEAARKAEEDLRDEAGQVVLDDNGKAVRVKKSPDGKTEHVSGYTTKTGKVVAPYTRRPSK